MKLVIVFILTLSVLSCVDHKHVLKEEIGLIDISKSLIKGEMVLLSTIAESIRYIELQSDSNCLLGRIDVPVNNIKVHSNRIFIADESRILAFDLNGKFLTQIGSQGRGPGEYMYPDDFAILDESERIAVFSKPSKKVLLYTLDGIYERDINIDFYPTSMTSFKSKLVFVSPPGRRHLTDYFTLTTMDESGEICNRLIEMNFEREVEKNKNKKIALT